LYLAISVLALALVSVGCAMMTLKAERYVAPLPGTTYTMARSDTGSYGSGNSQITSKVIERMWEGKRVTAIVSQAGALLLNSDGCWPAFLAPDDKPIVSYEPPIGYEWPLEVGKTWTKSYRVTMHATKQTIALDSTWKDEAYEDVTVPAGTFEAFKVSYSDTVGSETVQWSSPELGIFVKRMERRTNKHASGPGTRESQLVSYTIAK
jgi:hypothetical protein